MATDKTVSVIHLLKPAGREAGVKLQAWCGHDLKNSTDGDTRYRGTETCAACTAEYEAKVFAL